MDPTEQYVKDASRTDAPLTAELLHRLTNPITVELLHAALGMVTESAELADMLKKHIFANKPLDLVNASEEIGDELWYVAKAIRAIDTNMMAVMKQNIDKLRLRFPDTFSEEKSLGRDVVAERRLLEDTTGPQPGLSKRGQDWLKFSQDVLDHIENYTVPQYGDKGTDRASNYDLKTIAEHIGRYRDRIGTNARGRTEARRDFIKIAHYALLGYDLI